MPPYPPIVPNQFFQEPISISQNFVNLGITVLPPFGSTCQKGRDGLKQDLAMCFQQGSRSTSQCVTEGSLCNSCHSDHNSGINSQPLEGPCPTVPPCGLWLLFPGAHAITTTTHHNSTKGYVRTPQPLASSR